MIDIETRFRAMIESLLASKGLDDPGFQVGVPPDLDLGDLSTNIAMMIAKTLREPPLNVANEFAEILSQNKALNAVSVAPPGFINVAFNPDAFITFVEWYRQWYLQKPERTSPSHIKQLKTPLDPPSEPRNVLLEFVSANPTGPLNAVSARAGAAGDHLARLLTANGHLVDCEYYVNDMGRQVELLTESVVFRMHQVNLALDSGSLPRLGSKINLFELLEKDIDYPSEYISDEGFPEEGYRGKYIVNLAYFLVLTQGMPGSIDRIKEQIVGLIIKWIQKDLEEFGVTDMQLYHQKELHSGSEPYDEMAMTILKDQGLTYEKDGAIWLRNTDLGDDQDWVLIRSSNAGPTYFMADIAYHLQKALRKQKYNKLVDIWGPDHHAHVKRLECALTPILRAVGILTPEQQGKDILKIIIAQQVNLLDSSGETIKMSKRAGNLVTLHELIEDLGVDASRYFFLDRTLSSHLDFNLDLARRQTPENPIFRIQYTSARVASLLRRAREAGIEPLERFDGIVELDKTERNLMRLIAELPRTAKLAAENWEVHRIPSQLLDLAGEFHRWYDTHRVLGIDNENLSRARLALVEGIGGAICWGLDLMGVSSPDKM